MSDIHHIPIYIHTLSHIHHTPIYIHTLSTFNKTNFERHTQTDGRTDTHTHTYTDRHTHLAVHPCVGIASTYASCARQTAGTKTHTHTQGTYASCPTPRAADTLHHPTLHTTHTHTHTQQQFPPVSPLSCCRPPLRHPLPLSSALFSLSLSQSFFLSLSLPFSLYILY